MKQLVILAIALVIILFGFGLANNINEGIKNLIEGPEYCLNDVSQSDISIAAQGVSVSFTKTEGNQICFRTKDPSIVERLNKQIQDKKLEVQLAQIEANRQFWNQTAPLLILMILATIFLIVVIIKISEGRNYSM
jgi:hypothetical protein